MKLKNYNKKPKMNSAFFINIVRFFVLVLIQVTLFNNIQIFGYINPYPYILFIILYPVSGNRYSLIFLSFLLGLTIDAFGNSGGIHAAACLILAYYRNNLLKLSFGLSSEYQNIKVAYSSLKEQLLFVCFSVIVHHLMLFSLEAFNFALMGDVLLKTLLSGSFTVIFSVLIINLFKSSKK